MYIKMQLVKYKFIIVIYENILCAYEVELEKNFELLFNHTLSHK